MTVRSENQTPSFDVSPLEQDLRGKNALVTGATRGIGRAIALHLARRGASILGTCSSPHSLHHIESLSAMVKQAYKGSLLEAPDVTGVAADISSTDTPQQIGDAIERHFGGRVHIVITNAAYFENRDLGQLDDAYVQKMLFSNVHHLIMLMNSLLSNAFIQQNSRIVNVSSASTRSELPSSGMFTYIAAKAAVESLTRSWSDILGRNEATIGTTVNALAVGVTATESVVQTVPPEYREHVVNVLQGQKPFYGGVGRPEDVANVAGLLVGENANWITGSLVCANGGQTKII